MRMVFEMLKMIQKLMIEFDFDMYSCTFCFKRQCHRMYV